MIRKIEANTPANRYYASMHSPVFVVGSPRSGTSALVDVLSNIGYHGFLEGNFLTLLHQVETIVDRHYVWFPDTDKRVMLPNVDKNDLKRRLFEPFRTLVNDLNPTEPWFDKTGNPEMILAIPIVRELWPDSVFVLAKRRGIENITSRTKKFPGQPFEYHCSDWAKNMSAWRTIRQQLPPGSFIEVEQRDMIQQPERTARSLCEFLDADESGVTAACNVMSTHRPQETAKGTASRTLSLAESGWTDEQTETFLKHCEAEMKEFGYTMDEHYSVTL
jgi:Sulfotransferase family